MFTKESLQKQILQRQKDLYSKEDKAKQKIITKIIEGTPEVEALINAIAIRANQLAKGDIAMLLAYISTATLTAGLSLGYAMGVDEINDKSKLIV